MANSKVQLTDETVLIDLAADTVTAESLCKGYKAYNAAGDEVIGTYKGELMKDLLNCPNCGAPIKGSKCEYCGTVFSEKYGDDLSDLNEKMRLAMINISQWELTHSILNSIGPLHYNAILSCNDIRQSTQASIDELNRFQYQNLRASTNVYPYVERIPYPETKETFWQKVKNWWNMNGYLFGF